MAIGDRLKEWGECACTLESSYARIILWFSSVFTGHMGTVERLHWQFICKMFCTLDVAEH